MQYISTRTYNIKVLNVQCINFNKIIANAGLVFCTTLLATGLNAEYALINASLMAGVALFTELKTESELPPIKKIKRILAQALIL